jgi:transcription elongation factor Elf1
MARRPRPEPTRGGGPRRTVSSEQQLPVTLTTCEVCGSDGLTTTHCPNNTFVTCDRCGSRFDLYYRKDGAFFGYSSAWGTYLGAVHCAESVEDPNQVEEPGEMRMRLGIETYFYYLFRDANGVIRRVRMDAAPFRGDKPQSMPPKVNTYHYWVVDVLPKT